MSITITSPQTLHEFEQIHRLNYKTFVDEIPQHQANESGLLIDKFSSNSSYIIAKDGDAVIGMVCYHETRPFSLDLKLADLNQYLPSYQKLVEVRLLSVRPEYRGRGATWLLLQALCKTLIDAGVDAAVISATTRALPLYYKIGFRAFSDVVGSADAQYQPMFIRIEHLKTELRNA